MTLATVSACHQWPRQLQFQSAAPRPVYHMPVRAQSALRNPTAVPCFKRVARLISSLRLLVVQWVSAFHTLALRVCAAVKHQHKHTPVTPAFTTLPFQPPPRTGTLLACRTTPCSHVGLELLAVFIDPLAATVDVVRVLKSPSRQSEWQHVQRNTEVVVDKSKAHFKAELSSFNLADEICS